MPERNRNVKRFAVISVALVQFWLLSPMCCCWFKSVGKDDGVADSCCSRSNESLPRETPVDKNNRCQCSENKVELPPPQTIPTWDCVSQRLSLDRLAILQTDLIAVTELSYTQHSFEWPPPLAVSDRLANLHRLNL
jgi:hypothetical protein